MAFKLLLWISGACFQEPAIQWDWDWTVGMASEWLGKWLLAPARQFEDGLWDVLNPGWGGSQHTWEGQSWEEVVKYINFRYERRHSLQDWMQLHSTAGERRDRSSSALLLPPPPSPQAAPGGSDAPLNLSLPTNLCLPVPAS